MLVEFSVQNFRSFGEKQTFTMVASADRDAQQYAVPTGNNAAPYVLKQAALYGANGAGKSALIKGMRFMTDFVQNSVQSQGSARTCPTFAFHSEWREKPSEFEVVFLHDGSLFQYGFAISPDRVWEEWLFERPNKTGRLRQIFTRTYDAHTQSYDWDISASNLKGERESWRNQTRDDALFLSTAVQLNAEGLKRPYAWLMNGIGIILKVENLTHLRGNNFADPVWKERILHFLQGAGLSFSDIEAKEMEFYDRPEFLELPATTQDQMRKLLPLDGLKTRRVQTFRKDDLGNNTPLPFEEESEGTKGLFHLAGPILDSLEHGRTLIVDELNTYLHPLAFRHLTRLFCDREKNPNHAQLIFSTHDATLADGEALHRDQIWMVDKGDDFASRLKPYSDYKSRDGRSFRKGYLEGRFGAVPKLAG